MTTVARSPASVRAIVAVLLMFGMTRLALAVILGFEEADGTLLAFATALIAGAVGTVFLHLHFTRRLTSVEKRDWVRLLTGRRAPRAWSEYLTAADLSAAAVRLSEHRTDRTEP